MSTLLPGVGSQDVHLSDKPTGLGTGSTRFTAAEPLKVMGFTNDFCVVLADDVAKDADIDATYKQLKGGARLSAVLHASGRSGPAELHGAIDCRDTDESRRPFSS